MSKLMLIDAAHPEETRVAVVTDQQVDDFDFETKGREQLRGNIYLAKVTRVEPSLQAAFVEYGGNRHGFLAFSEIHPDYYQLPQADREALLKAAAEEAAANEDDDFDLDDDEDEDEESGADASDDEEDDEDEDDDADEAEASEDSDSDEEDGDEDEDEASASSDEDGEDGEKKPAAKKQAKPAARGRGAQRKKRPPRNSYLKKYKIQEVIRRRQVMLVQVAKEERGNKGAALTTYLSLAGRYSVLMPNTPRGGGISRKIANGADRKRLKSIVSEFDMPDGMGLIVRTAGAKRTKAEIKRDYDYLIKLWHQICDKTLSSMAPCLINAEGGLVHRAMRDMFHKDLEEVLIQGESAYREAKDLANLIMPSQARKVKKWTDPVPVFVDHGIDEQLDSIFKPEVRLKSGGYLVINQTEALVAIDVNSGKSTKARNIEQTALQTNLEAAEEACRQMRLRDLAGLVVIDFIDMDENKNVRAIEKAMKDHLKIDRARVQFGRISQFGLMEISRQRRRAGFLQATSDPCPSCNGTGRVRSVESATLQLLRAIEARAAHGGLKSITVEAPTDVALYLLNHKREEVAAVEASAGFAITVTSSDSLLAGDFTIHAEKDPNAKSRPKRNRRKTAPEEPSTASALDVVDLDEEDEDAAPEAVGETSEDEGGEGSRRKRRRRGRRGGRRRRREEGTAPEAETVKAVADVPDLEPIDPDSLSRPKGDIVPEDGGAFLDGVSLTVAEMLDNPETAEAELAEVLAEAAAPAETQAQDTGEDTGAEPGEEGAPKKRRRRRRGGRGRNKSNADAAGSEAEADAGEDASEDEAEADAGAEEAGDAPAEVEEVSEPETAEAEAASDEPAPAEEPAVEAEAETAPEPEPEPEPAPEPEVTADTETPPEPQPEPEPEATAEPEPPAEPEAEAEPEEKKPRRMGWWNRKRA